MNTCYHVSSEWYSVQCCLLIKTISFGAFSCTAEPLRSHAIPAFEGKKALSYVWGSGTKNHYMFAYQLVTRGIFQTLLDPFPITNIGTPPWPLFFAQPLHLELTIVHSSGDFRTGMQTQAMVSPPIWDRKEPHQLLLAAQCATWLWPHFRGLFSPACFFFFFFIFALTSPPDCFCLVDSLPCFYTQCRNCGFPLPCLELGTESFLGFSSFFSWLFLTIWLGCCLLIIMSNCLTQPQHWSDKSDPKQEFLFSPTEDEVN